MSDAEKDQSTLVSLCVILGYTVLFNTFIDKIPQSYNILTSRSTEGISLFSVVAEMSAYSSMLTYQFAMSYPFHTYMENVVMVLQDYQLLAILLYYRNMFKVYLIPYIALYVTLYTFVAMYWLPEAMMVAVMYFTTPLLCWSKMRQLIEILIMRDPGQLSSITWFLICYDTAVRMFTTAVITKDIPMFVNLASSEVLNLSVFLSIIYYNVTKTRRRRSSSSRDR